MASPEPHVHLEVESDLGNVELVQTVLEEALRGLELDPEAAHAIGIAVREAVANAIKHGNHQDPEKRVEIDVEVDGQELVIRVTDQGGGFDPEAIASPLARENLLRPNGRGIFFMSNFMDSIDYSFKSEGGTVVTLRKRVGLPLPERQSQEETDL